MVKITLYPPEGPQLEYETEAHDFKDGVLRFVPGKVDPSAATVIQIETTLPFVVQTPVKVSPRR
jgi:hypothetical protein